MFPRKAMPVQELRGTKMFCPHCQEINECRAIKPNEVGLKGGQRWYRTDSPDIQWFRRIRQCLGCSEVFITAEVNEDYLDELVELRSALREIKLNAEQYLKESTAASKTLTKLSASLGVLQALNIYQSEK
jgi:hypothetical protein